MELAWLGLTIALVIAVFFRKTHYQLFYYVHHMTIIFLVATFIHAWVFWCVYLHFLMYFSGQQ